MRRAVIIKWLNKSIIDEYQSNALHPKDHHVHLLHVLLPQHRD